MQLNKTDPVGDGGVHVADPAGQHQNLLDNRASSFHAADGNKQYNFGYVVSLILTVSFGTL